jgi:hypothetical protein
MPEIRNIAQGTARSHSLVAADREVFDFCGAHAPRVLEMAQSAAACSSPKDKPNSARRERILFFLKRFGFFPFVGSERNPTSTKNENQKYDNSMLKKVNRPREQKEIYEPAHT